MTHSPARVWAERAQAELGAAGRYRDLQQRVRSARGACAVLPLLERAIEDEERHAYRCAQMALELGHGSGFATPKALPSQALPSWSGRSDCADRLLLDLVSLCCITESFNASLLHTLYQRTERGPLRRLLHDLLRDEVRHAQIGWAFLGAERQRRDCSFVGAFIGEMLTRSVQEVLFEPVDVQPDAAVVTDGVLHEQVRLEHFQQTLETVILPGFAHHGVDTSALTAWLRSRSPDGREV